MKRHRCLKETNHRRTYNLVRKELYAVCSRCAWHSNFWRSCGDNPYVYTYLEDGRSQVKNPPNWKLVSKNRKQWMNKHFFKRRKERRGEVVTYYGW